MTHCCCPHCLFKRPDIKGISHLSTPYAHLNRLSAGPPHTRWNPLANAANCSATLPHSSQSLYRSTKCRLLSAVTGVLEPPGISSTLLVSPRASYSTSKFLAGAWRQGMAAGENKVIHRTDCHVRPKPKTLMCNYCTYIQLMPECCTAALNADDDASSRRHVRNTPPLQITKFIGLMTQTCVS